MSTIGISRSSISSFRESKDCLSCSKYQLLWATWI